jgi:hypothetical protein
MSLKAALLAYLFIPPLDGEGGSERKRGAV